VSGLEHKTDTKLIQVKLRTKIYNIDAINTDKAIEWYAILVFTGEVLLGVDCQNLCASEEK